MDSIDVPNSPGIYCIRNTITNLIYVGSAINLRKRKNSHFSTLRKGIHDNAKLQNAFNKYGESSFIFEILEIVLLPEMLTAREQHWFSKLQPFGKRGYNIAQVAGSTLGMPAPNRGVKSSLTTEQHRLFHASQARTIIAIDPDGVEHLVIGVRAFCQERGLNCTSMMRTARGELDEHKGWKAYFPEGAKQEYPKPSKPRKRRKHSKATREKMSISALNHGVSESTRAKLVAAASKEREISVASRQKMSTTGKTRHRTPEEYASRRKVLIATSPDGTEYYVKGISPFCKEHGLDGSSLTKVAKGKIKQHRGWTARYPSEEAS